ncbi:(2Fe-2S)-binding protein [Candidatus Bipolaricaulota bacterium]|jgi:carbon-monoxide dehydrogenase small subunit|nr:(2Fe-2S)-binding protein [Candidatus Bipolaricaulota bacterium]
MRIQCTVNGKSVERDISPDLRLLDFIRETLQLTGTKEGCGEGECGACTVLLDGKAVNSCLVLAMQADGSVIITVEGLADGQALHPIQEAYVEVGAVQCGFCTPGFIMATYALLQDTPDPSEEEILAGLEGNLCRCTGYSKILDAVKLAARRMREPK